MSIAIRRIRERLARHPELAVDEGLGWIEVRPPGDASFSVGLTDEGTSYTVHFEGWHEDCETLDGALNLFAMGLSDSVRLEVTRRGTDDHKWTLEVLTAEGWTAESTTGLVLVPFWRRKHVRYLQNAVIKRRDSF